MEAIIDVTLYDRKRIFITGVSASGTGGAYSGSPSSAKLLTNCAIPEKEKQKFSTAPQLDQ